MLYIVAVARGNLLGNAVRSRPLPNELPFKVARHKCIPLDLAQLSFATAPTAVWPLRGLNTYPLGEHSVLIKRFFLEISHKTNTG